MLPSLNSPVLHSVSNAVSSGWMLNIIIWATRYEFHSKLTGTGTLLDYRDPQSKTCSIFPPHLSPTGVTGRFESVCSCTGENVKDALPLFSAPEASLLMSTFKGALSVLCCFSCRPLMKAESITD